MATLPVVGASAPLDASDNSWLSFTASANNEVLSRDLNSLPADFAAMATLLWKVEYNQLNRTDDTLGLDIRIMSGATVLAAADAGGTFSVVSNAVTSATDVTTGPTAFAYVNTTASKTVWEAAVVELRQRYTSSMGNDGASVRVDLVEFTGTYTEPTLVVADAAHAHTSDQILTPTSQPCDVFPTDTDDNTFILVPQIESLPNARYLMEMALRTGAAGTAYNMKLKVVTDNEDGTVSFPETSTTGYLNIGRAKLERMTDTRVLALFRSGTTVNQTIRGGVLDIAGSSFTVNSESLSYDISDSATNDSLDLARISDTTALALVGEEGVGQSLFVVSISGTAATANSPLDVPSSFAPSRIVAFSSTAALLVCGNAGDSTNELVAYPVTLSGTSAPTVGTGSPLWDSSGGRYISPFFPANEWTYFELVKLSATKAVAIYNCSGTGAGIYARIIDVTSGVVTLGTEITVVSGNREINAFATLIDDFIYVYFFSTAFPDRYAEGLLSHSGNTLTIETQPDFTAGAADHVLDMHGNNSTAFTGWPSSVVVADAETSLTRVAFGTQQDSNAPGYSITVGIQIWEPTLPTDVTLVVADTAHSHAVENVVLTQLHELTVADAAHGHTVEAVTLVADGTSLEMADAFHAHDAEVVALTQLHSLVVQDVTHDHVVELVALVQQHSLLAADAAHAHAVGETSLLQGLPPRPRPYFGPASQRVYRRHGRH